MVAAFKKDRMVEPARQGELFKGVADEDVLNLDCLKGDSTVHEFYRSSSVS